MSGRPYCWDCGTVREYCDCDARQRARETMLAKVAEIDEELGVYATDDPVPAASVDTHPKDGDSTQIEAPLVSGAVPHEDEADAQPHSGEI